MKRVSMEAANREGSVILNNMPKFISFLNLVVLYNVINEEKQVLLSG